MQIAQMVVGVVVSLSGYFYYQNDPTGCAIHPYVIKVSAVIYASYLYLVRLYLFVCLIGFRTIACR
jgi:hypothetical protein